MNYWALPTLSILYRNTSVSFVWNDSYGGVFSMVKFLIQLKTNHKVVEMKLADVLNKNIMPNLISIFYSLSNCMFNIIFKHI